MPRRSENVNGSVDGALGAGELTRVLAQVEVTFSNSMIEAFWRSLKHSWLYLHSLDSFAALRRLIEFYVKAHNGVIPHAAFQGPTPDEIFFGIGDAVPQEACGRPHGGSRETDEGEPIRGMRRMRLGGKLRGVAIATAALQNVVRRSSAGAEGVARCDVRVEPPIGRSARSDAQASAADLTSKYRAVTTAGTTASRFPSRRRTSITANARPPAALKKRLWDASHFLAKSFK
jgi:hypothetical protein